MRLRLTKLLVICSIVFLASVALPQKAEAFASDVTGRVVTNTGAPVVGVWVKWTDGVGGYQYARTDNTGTYFFTSISTIYANGQIANLMATPVDTNLDGTNDDNMMYEIDPVNAPVWDFSCGSNDHSFTAVTPVGMSGSFSTVTGILIDNGENLQTLSDIVFIPAGPQLYYIKGDVFIDDNRDGQYTYQTGESRYKDATIFATITNLSNNAQTQLSSDVGNYGSDASGKAQYFFQAGTYRIDYTQPPGYAMTTPNSFTVTLGPSCDPGTGVQAYCQNGSVEEENFGFNIPPVCKTANATIMLVIDHSSSMEDPDPATGLKKIDEAKRAAKKFVDTLGTNYLSTKVGVVQFAGSYNYPSEPSSVSVLIAPTTNFASVKNAIDAVTSVAKASNDDGTCIECGVVTANNALLTTTSPIVIFLTDGIANDTTTSNGSSTVPVTAAENNAMVAVNNGVKTQGIIYHTIGVGTGASNIDEPFLTQIAAANNGYYYNDPTNGNLSNIYTTIATNVCSATNPTPTPIQTYSVSGNVYLDSNQNSLKDAAESNYTGTPNIVTSRGTVTMSPGGLYTISGVTAGPLDVSLQTLPAGYFMVNPLNGPPPTWQIKVGPTCSTGGAPGAVCQ